MHIIIQPRRDTGAVALEIGYGNACRDDRYFMCTVSLFPFSVRLVRYFRDVRPVQPTKRIVNKLYSGVSVRLKLIRVYRRHVGTNHEQYINLYRKRN